MKTKNYTRILYRIKKVGKEKGYVSNNHIGLFEFLSKQNAKDHIKEKNLKDVVIERADQITIIETNGPNFTKTINTETREII